MEINGAEINSNLFGGTNGVIYLPTFIDTQVKISRLAIRLVAGFNDSSVDTELFYWDTTLNCTLRDLFAPNCDTEFDSVRDDGKCNKNIKIKNRCILYPGEIPGTTC